MARQRYTILAECARRGYSSIEVDFAYSHTSGLSFEI